MDDKRNEQVFDDGNVPLTPPSDEPPTPRSKRIIALIAAIFVIALTLLYTYSIATGKIFAF